jgi:hypothetical protein
LGKKQFLGKAFVNVVNWLGSVWDAFRYFKLREQVSASFCGINLERPLVCYHTLRSKEDFSRFAGEDRKALCELHQLFLLEMLPKYGSETGWQGM